MASGRSTHEFLKFVLVGAVSFIAHNIVYLLLCNIIPHAVAYTLGYASWMVINFLLSNYVTFHTKPTVRRAVGFAISSGVYYLIQLGGFTLCRLVALPDVIVTPVVYTVSFPINFLMVRYVLKREK